MRTDNDIKQEGFNALAEKLDIVEVERFFMLINKEKFDYTKWRKNLFENISVEELSSRAMDFVNHS
ncbi:MAG: hypothetical protein RO257_07705 [Candidatus Kapabacteria bacterium]|jgi:hypothetical protein|nr:hypothetical protein [Candidatus Kapabacteria bacterium]